jgi:hypothetical protein
MQSLTLFAERDRTDTLSRVLATDDGRFSLSAQLCRDVRSDDPEDDYLHLRAWFASPNEEAGFSAFHVVIDLKGALLQMVVGETHRIATSRLLRRMRENDIELTDVEELTAEFIDERKASGLKARAGAITLRAKAYPSDKPLDESLLCLRLLYGPVGAVQVVISDLGRLLAMGTGRRDRDAFERVRQELIRKGVEVKASDGSVAGTRSTLR